MVTLRFLDVNKRVVPLIMLIYSSFYMLVLSFTNVSAILSSASHPLRGDMIRCQNEGENVKVHILSDDPCITCKCINQEIVCHREVCPNFKGCYLLFYGKNRTCCDVCKGCLYNGDYYKSGQKFADSSDPCRNFECNAGVITEYRTQCHVPCSNPVSIPGKCCPLCEIGNESGDCELDGKIYKDGEQMPNTSNDKCVKCECTKGKMVCSKSACPVLACPQSKWMTHKDECCPTCRGHRKVTDFEGNCIMGLSAYRDGQAYTYDQCTSCICNATTNICQRKVCPPIDCPPMYQIMEPEDCCPKCHEPQQLRATCQYGGQQYNSGDKWKINNCQKCSCVNGEVRCVAEICSKDLVCPERYKLTRLKGDCCSSCVEDDVECKVSNNLTKYTTFDGKEYTFDGKCNYILARDCKNKAFSVHIVNKLHFANETFHYDANKTHTGSSVMVKIEDTKVRLGVSDRVRVGRKRVKLPHIVLGILSIVQDGNKIVLRANIGIKVIWDKSNAIEVVVPPEYKSRTCGLCGNYNNNPEDDFMTKRGIVISEIEKFSNSWRVGKNMVCPDILDTTTKAINEPMKCKFKKWEHRYHAINVCNILKSSIFRQCHSDISITPFFSKCLTEMCLCNANQEKSCTCSALQSYANKCQKLAHFNPHWKKKTLCEATNCPRGSLFSTCSSPCKRTCKNYRKHRSCRKRTCRPGCECPIGQVWHNGKCIYKQLCPLPTPSTSHPNILSDELVT